MLPRALGGLLTAAAATVALVACSGGSDDDGTGDAGARPETSSGTGSSVVGPLAAARARPITTTVHCRGGTLTVRYFPIQRSLVQGSQWEVVDGTGSFADLRGGGTMVAVFDEDDPDRGREVFTGTVGE